MTKQFEVECISESTGATAFLVFTADDSAGALEQAARMGFATGAVVEVKPPAAPASVTNPASPTAPVVATMASDYLKVRAFAIQAFKIAVGFAIFCGAAYLIKLATEPSEHEKMKLEFERKRNEQVNERYNQQMRQRFGY